MPGETGGLAVGLLFTGKIIFLQKRKTAIHRPKKRGKTMNQGINRINHGKIKKKNRLQEGIGLCHGLGMVLLYYSQKKTFTNSIDKKTPL